MRNRCRASRRQDPFRDAEVGLDMRLNDYETDGFYDEMFDKQGQPRSRADALAKRLVALSEGELVRRQKAADLTLLNMGITFAVYGHEAGTEKVWPFDIVPRIVDAA